MDNVIVIKVKSNGGHWSVNGQHTQFIAQAEHTVALEPKTGRHLVLASRLTPIHPDRVDSNLLTKNEMRKLWRRGEYPKDKVKQLKSIPVASIHFVKEFWK